MSTLGIVQRKNSVGHRDNESKYRPYGVVDYADSNYARDIDNQKSIIGYYFFLGGVITTWYSKRQQTISILTSKAKHVAMSHGAKEGVWIWRFLNELFPEQTVRKIQMLGDNETGITLIKDSESQNHIKHIDVMHDHMRGFMEDKELGIEQISNFSMIAIALQKLYL